MWKPEPHPGATESELLEVDPRNVLNNEITIKTPQLILMHNREPGPSVQEPEKIILSE